MENPEVDRNESDVNAVFLDGQLFHIEELPWYADIVNHLENEVVSASTTHRKWKKERALRTMPKENEVTSAPSSLSISLKSILRYAEKIERKVIEKNRRNKMKSLYSNLNSLLPTPHSNLPLTVSEQIEEVIKSIKSLEIKLKKDEEKKERLLRKSKMSLSSPSYTALSTNQNRNVPELKIKEMGSAVEVVLTTGLEDRSIFYEIIRIFNEERVEIINVSYSDLESTIIYSLHAEIEDVVYEFGGTKLIERLKKLVHEPNNDPELQAVAVFSSHGGTNFPADVLTTSSHYNFWSN
ncbi:transcription factor bHLH162-like [Benincasa hispida]|uniref:transcription factor bHLH162-like n=1 Tax=Benincasa hispida TaxID=102211 RepID=UPI001900B08D|nr:transcription factor bHLH162-like [Benincasa hispida]